MPCGEDLFFLLAANVCDLIINATSVIVNNAHRNNSGFISAICITPERRKKLSKVSGKSEKSQSCTQHVSLHPLQNTGRLEDVCSGNNEELHFSPNARKHERRRRSNFKSSFLDTKYARYEHMQFFFLA